MSCCSSSGTCGCPVQPCPSTYVLTWFPRIAFGLVLAGYGVNHYRNMADFAGMAKSAFPTVPALGAVAGMLSYIVPALMIAGGVLFAVRQLCCIAKMCIVASLMGIIGWAGLAVLVGEGSAGMTMMPMIQNAAVLFIFFVFAKKMSCKSSCSASSSCKTGAPCAGGSCK